jgi:hypothetical protein
VSEASSGGFLRRQLLHLRSDFLNITSLAA